MPSCLGAWPRGPVLARSEQQGRDARGPEPPRGPPALQVPLEITPRAWLLLAHAGRGSRQLQCNEMPGSPNSITCQVLCMWCPTNASIPQGDRPVMNRAIDQLVNEIYEMVQAAWLGAGGRGVGLTPQPGGGLLAGWVAGTSAVHPPWSLLLGWHLGPGEWGKRTHPLTRAPCPGPGRRLTGGPCEDPHSHPGIRWHRHPTLRGEPRSEVKRLPCVTQRRPRRRFQNQTD